MRGVSLFFLLAGLMVHASASASDQGVVSVERGLQVSITGGCHDCHSEGYMESGGKIDPARALMGSSIGFRGPWGTTYAVNLRLTARLFSERAFVAAMKALKTNPPMPWFNVRAMDESDLRSLYAYIKSLGEPGKQVPVKLGPGQEPRTPYIVLSPPQMPK